MVRIRSWSTACSVEVAEGEELSWFADDLAGYEEGWVAFADVHEALGALEGLRLGVITNGEGT